MEVSSILKLQNILKECLVLEGDEEFIGMNNG
jgi:hypothetical protein